MRPSLSSRQMMAFKIGARARKFALEECPIEGYDYLYACLEDARASDPELYALLTVEVEKFSRRMEALEAEQEARDEGRAGEGAG